ASSGRSNYFSSQVVLHPDKMKDTPCRTQRPRSIPPSLDLNGAPMVRPVPPIVFVVALLAFSMTKAAPAADEKTFSAEQVQFFEAQVRPVLVEHCLGCHGE